MPSFATVEKLNEHVSSRSYVTGYSLSKDDKECFAALSCMPCQKATPHAYRWALHIAALTGASILASSSSGAKAAAKAPLAAADDMDDMFGGDDEELNDEGETAAEAAATKARQERMALAKKLKDEKDAKDGKVKSTKEKPAEKSLVVLEVKPWEADTDLKMVWEKICEYKQDGLAWGQTYKLEPVAYGIMKLVMTCTIVDALVLMDDITENIEAIEEYVQSVQVLSMNKI